MEISRRIARILGPTLVAFGVTEALNIEAFAGIPATVVYLDGTLLFIAGVAIVQAHNRWARSWSVLVTLAGWFLLAGGLYRMFAPQATQMAGDAATYATLAVVFTIGGLLTYKGYRGEGA